MRRIPFALVLAFLAHLPAIAADPDAPAKASDHRPDLPPGPGDPGPRTASSGARTAPGSAISATTATCWQSKAGPGATQVLVDHEKMKALTPRSLRSTISTIAPDTKRPATSGCQTRNTCYSIPAGSYGSSIWRPRLACRLRRPAPAVEMIPNSLPMEPISLTFVTTICMCANCTIAIQPSGSPIRKPTPCLMAKWTGCTKKNSRCAATTSGRRTRAGWRTCR